MISVRIVHAWKVLNLLSLAEVHLCSGLGCACCLDWSGQGAGLEAVITSTPGCTKAEPVQLKVTLATTFLLGHPTWAYVNPWGTWDNLSSEILCTKHSWTASRFMPSAGDAHFLANISDTNLNCALVTLDCTRCKIATVWSHSGIKIIWHHTATCISHSTNWQI